MNIYISNLSFNINDQDLKELFDEYGSVSSAKVIFDRATGKSRGFGFVEMSDNDEARKAIAELDKAEYDGKTINVSEARPRTDKPRNFGGGNRGGGYNSGGGGYNSGRRGGNR
ncbi:MAG: RNA-binding protein [Bacteroidales bacterium]|nr:RNA-binding protein [Bacteroidales bacterium]